MDHVDQMMSNARHLDPQMFVPWLHHPRWSPFFKSIWIRPGRKDHWCAAAGKNGDRDFPVISTWDSCWSLINLGKKLFYIDGSYSSFFWVLAATKESNQEGYWSPLIPACSGSSFYQNCVQQYFTTWRYICWWYETLRIRCIWGVPPVFGHKRSSKVAKWRSKQYTYYIYIYIYLYISRFPSIQVLSRYFQVSCFEVRNSNHNPISVPQGLWCSALVAHLHPHWRSNAMFHVTWCLSETSQLNRQQ